MIEKLIRRIAHELDKNSIPYMIIGGQAVLLYGTPRLTRDIDITLGIDTDRYTQIAGVCKKLKLKLLPPEPARFARDTKVLPAEETESKIRIDFIFSFTPYERQAMKRTRRVILNKYPVKFASPEDVIVHKMIASRAVDLEDVKNILIKMAGKLNMRYIRKWLSEFDQISSLQDVLDRFDQVRESAK